MVAFVRSLIIAIIIFAVIVVGAVIAFSDPDVPDDVLVAKYGQKPSQFVTLGSGARVHYRDRASAMVPHSCSCTARTPRCTHGNRGSRRSAINSA